MPESLTGPGATCCIPVTGKTHLVHVDCIILGQHLLQGVGDTGEFQCVRTLAVDVVTQDLCGPLGFDNFQGANGDPANAFHPFKVCLVQILRSNRKEGSANSPIASSQNVSYSRHRNTEGR